MLQRSRDVAAAETRFVEAISTEETRLQRSRDVAAAETLRALPDARAMVKLQRSRDVAAAETPIKPAPVHLEW